jgi:hypothetical protein
MKKIEKALDDFTEEISGPPVPINVQNNNSTTKKVIIDEREGLIERVDKILVTKNGKQLLREQY